MLKAKQFWQTMKSSFPLPYEYAIEKLFCLQKPPLVTNMPTITILVLREIRTQADYNLHEKYEKIQAY